MPAAVALRKQMRARRRALPAAERHRCARQLARRVVSLKAFSHAHHIAAYLAVDGEMDRPCCWSGPGCWASSLSAGAGRRPGGASAVRALSSAQRDAA